MIENDDRTYSLADVLELHRRTGLRVVWDILHHHCHDPDGIPDREALEAAWPPGRRREPKIHYSTPKTAMEERTTRSAGGRRTWVLPQLRAHADLIDPIAFEHFLRATAAGLDFDVMLEAKGKDLALLRLREQWSGNRPRCELNPSRVRISHNRHGAHEHARGHAAERPVPARRPGGHGRDVDGLPRLRRDARAPRGDQAHAPRHRGRLRPAGALPPRGPRGRPALAPAHRRRDRRRRGRGPPLHRLRVRRGRDAEGPHPPARPAAGRRGDRLRDRDRPRARRRARPRHRPPRRQAPERPGRRGGLGQGHRLRHRPLDATTTA